MDVEEKSAEQKKSKLIFAKLYLIRKLKFHIFNSIAVILYLSLRSLYYFRENLKAILLLNLFI